MATTKVTLKTVMFINIPLNAKSKKKHHPKNNTILNLIIIIIKKLTGIVKAEDRYQTFEVDKC